MKILTLILCSMTFFSISAQYNADRHNTSYNKGWLSCSSNESPNPVRGKSHWIMYDLGQIYHLGETTVWNTNYSDNTNMGIKDMTIDYSIDGTTWLEYGVFEIMQASASNFYTGSSGPDLSGLEARFLLITAVSNYGGPCTGFSEIRFTTAGVVSDVVDIDELEGEISISPNPMYDVGKAVFTNIETGDYVMQITDMRGRVIQRSKIVISSDKTSVDLNFQDISSGLYSLTLTDGNRLKSKTFEIIK